MPVIGPRQARVRPVPGGLMFTAMRVSPRPAPRCGTKS